MKKDKKFLKDLEDNLGNIKKKYKEEIISKYQNIINEEKSKKRKITSIIKDLGDPKEIAQSELKLIKKDNFFKKISSSIKKIFSPKKKKKDNYIKEETKRIKKEIREEKRNNFKNKLKSFGLFLTRDIKLKDKNKVNKEKIKIEKEPTIVEDVVNDFDDEVSNVSEIVAEKKIFESKKDRNKRILLKTLGIILTILLLFIWLWVSVVFIASIFAYLDGIRFVGINIILFGIDALVLWIVIMVNRAIFKKKNNLRLNLIISIICIVIIAFGIVITMKQISEIETVKDVSVKYSMTTKLSTYDLPNELDKKFNITFNSNYNTQYVMNYDDTLKDKIKVEVKYYECYYDYYVKETSNSSYISLKLDNRDRLSVYIDDLKDGQVFDNDELSRYVVRISINPDDVGRLVIND